MFNDPRTIYYDVRITPEDDARMKAMAKRIGATQAHVFDRATKLYYNVKSQQMEKAGTRLYLEDREGNRTEVEVS